jgi:hypothetical protein
MPPGHTTVPASGSTAAWAKYAGPSLGREVDIPNGAVAEQQSQHLVADRGNASNDGKVVVVHSFDRRPPGVANGGLFLLAR